jgi:2-polyprenyl-3-methyl-5-hydroxy-6-metoxy-1,4-benzoquinol methylase
MTIRLPETSFRSAENPSVKWTVKLLNMRGLHFLARRFGTRKLQQAAYNARFLSGEWNTGPVDVSQDLVEVILRHASGGKVALMGCGTGGLAAILDRSECTSILGIDLSSVAVKRARMRGLARAQFEVADFASWGSMEQYDAIVFEESLYYLSPKEQVRVLAAHRLSLTRAGVFVITVSDAARYRTMLKMIRSRFHILEDRDHGNSNHRLVVFR